ncbi:MAG: hypothetical protein ACRD33_10195 [Candidatus Acidiferrales bacterium]
MFKKRGKFYADFYQGKHRVRKQFPTAKAARAFETDQKKDKARRA